MSFYHWLGEMKILTFYTKFGIGQNDPLEVKENKKLV